VVGVAHPALLLVPHEVIVDSAKAVIAVEDARLDKLLWRLLLARLELNIKLRCRIRKMVIGETFLSLGLEVLHSLLLSARILITTVVECDSARTNR
jgi:hypothetical protein